MAIVRRGWDTFERLADVKYPTLALIRGFCLGGGLELALACRYRVVVDEPGTRLGLPEVMLGIVPGWGGIKRLPRLVGAPAALDLLLTGKTIDARRAKKMGIVDECVPVRIMENTVRGVLRASPPPRTLPLPLSLTLNPLARRFIAAQAEKQVAKRARRDHYPAPYAILELFTKYDGNALLPPPGDPASIPSLLSTPTAANLIRVFRLQERLKSLGKEGEFKAAHVHVVGAGTMGGDIAAWCALRGLTVTLQDQNAERLAPAMKRASEALCRSPEGSASRARRARPAHSGRRGRRRRARRRHRRGDLRERRRQAFALRIAREESEARRDAREQHVEHSAGGNRHGAGRPVATHRHSLLQSRRAHDAGRDRGRAARRARTSWRARRRSCARSTSCRCRSRARRAFSSIGCSRRISWRRCAPWTKASRPKRSTRPRSPSACRWGRSSSPTRSASTSASK